MEKRTRRLVLTPLSSRLARQGLITNVPCRLRPYPQMLQSHSKVSFAQRHSHHQVGASNLVLPSPRHRLAVQQQIQISIDQFGKFPCSPKHDRTQKSLGTTVREAFADVVLSFQMMCQRE